MTRAIGCGECDPVCGCCRLAEAKKGPLRRAVADAYLRMNEGDFEGALRALEDVIYSEN